MRRSHIAVSVAVILAVGSLDALAERRARASRARGDARLGRLIEANVVATHAYQVLLAKRSARGDATCFSPGRLSDAELSALVDHQERLLKTDAAEVRAWALRGASGSSRSSRSRAPSTALPIGRGFSRSITSI
jgi:hypothetical protein